MRKPCEINWTQRARSRLRVRQNWIEEQSGSAEIAAGWAGRVTAATAQLPDFPYIGRVVPEFGRDDIRELIVEGTTRIFYRVHDGCCDILSVRRARELLGSLRAL